MTKIQSLHRNSVPQNPLFPADQRLRLLSEATDLFRLNFPYTTVYPSLGNLDFFPHEEELTAGGAFGAVSRLRTEAKRRRHRMRIRQREEEEREQQRKEGEDAKEGEEEESEGEF